MLWTELVRHPLGVFGLSLLCASLSSCGSSDMKVAPVSGTVTLDGEPLGRASVVFQPDAGGRPSFGVTDENGKYTLNYNMHEGGAEVGSCTVKISTRVQETDPDGNYDDDAKLMPERVPAKYAKEPVVVTVESKSNTIDIALTTK